MTPTREQLIEIAKEAANKYLRLKLGNRRDCDVLSGFEDEIRDEIITECATAFADFAVLQSQGSERGVVEGKTINQRIREACYYGRENARTAAAFFADLVDVHVGICECDEPASPPPPAEQAQGSDARDAERQQLSFTLGLIFAIERALKHASPSEILDENSPIRDAIREVAKYDSIATESKHD